MVLPFPLREKLAIKLGTPECTPADVRRLLARAETVRTETSGRMVTCCGALFPGGAERQLVNTLRGLAGRGLRDRLLLLAHQLTPDRPEQFDFYLPMLQDAGVETREIRHPATRREPLGVLPAPILAALERLPLGLATDIADHYREFVEIRPAVVHAWLDWSNVRAGLAAILAGVPRIIVSGRNLNPSNFFFDMPYLRPAYEVMARYPHVIFINNSAAGAADYADWLGLPHARVGVVRNGVDFSAADRPSARAIAEFRASLGVPASAPLVGGLFRFSPEKRPALWIEAARLVAQARPESRFAIFGTGPLRAEMLALANACGLGDRLTMADVTPAPLVALAAFDVCLLTSTAEGTSNVALEAQWLGTPVVATAGGGTRESLDVDASGWVVDEATPANVANAVLAVLSDPTRRAEAAKRGPAFIAARFGVERMIRETLDLYGLADGTGR